MCPMTDTRKLRVEWHHRVVLDMDFIIFTPKHVISHADIRQQRELVPPTFASCVDPHHPS